MADTEKKEADAFFDSKNFYIKLAFVVGFIVLVVIVYSKFKKENT